MIGAICVATCSSGTVSSTINSEEPTRITDPCSTLTVPSMTWPFTSVPLLEPMILGMQLAADRPEPDVPARDLGVLQQDVAAAAPEGHLPIELEALPGQRAAVEDDGDHPRRP